MHIQQRASGQCHQKLQVTRIKVSAGDDQIDALQFGRVVKIPQGSGFYIRNNQYLHFCPPPDHTSFPVSASFTTSMFSASQSISMICPVDRKASSAPWAFPSRSKITPSNGLILPSAIPLPKHLSQSERRTRKIIRQYYIYDTGRNPEKIVERAVFL